jgi:hypothetical protein
MEEDVTRSPMEMYMRAITLEENEKVQKRLLTYHLLISFILKHIDFRVNYLFQEDLMTFFTMELVLKGPSPFYDSYNTRMGQKTNQQISKLCIRTHGLIAFFFEYAVGQGMYTWKKPRSRYVGSYLANNRHGEGALVYPDGGRYKGGFSEGKRHGKGLYIYPNGDFYEGEWVNDLKHGKGMYIFVDTGSKVQII